MKPSPPIFSLPRLIVAGTHSGVGKTTITAGIIGALRERGHVVQPFKAGPDYIDPSYHTLATQVVDEGQRRICRNLDTWMISPERIPSMVALAGQGADLAVIEGVMGLYDGSAYDRETGSTAHLSKLLAAPTLLVVDASSMARSAGALALGYMRFDPDLPLAGFIVNRVGSGGHGKGVTLAIEQATGLPVLGCIPRQAELKIPERYLGLIPTVEPGAWRSFIAAAIGIVSRHVDVDRLVRIVYQSPPMPGTPLALEPSATPQTVKIAVACDQAFSFTYEDNLDLLRQAGAELVTFSPLRDRCLPSGIRGILLSGGFPEVYGAQLAANETMRRAIRDAWHRGVVIYAECGGLMYLTQYVVDMQGERQPMVGLLPGYVTMSPTLHMGYRLACAAPGNLLLDEGATVRGHEFHYSRWEGRPDNLPPAYWVQSARSEAALRPEGACLQNLMASYVHVHFASVPDMAIRFVQSCTHVH
jgi:cobyrinic acid a,c-diamide synthase